MARDYGITARFTSNTDEIGITDFTFDVPDGVIGAQLTATLADFEPVFDESLPVQFEIGIQKSGTLEYASLMDVGRVLGTAFHVERLNSQVTVTAINSIADRWELAPRNPVVLYDPEQMGIVTASQSVRGDVIDSEGVVIEPVFRRVEDLDLAQLLQFSYIESCGFAEIVTNVPTYPIKQAVFGLQSSFHSVVSSQIEIFKPVYSADDADRLLIVDPQGVLPPSLPVRGLGPAKYVTADREKQSARIITAVLFSYRENSVAVGEDIIDRVDQESQEVGTFGEPGFQRTVVSRFVKEFHGNPDNPDQITREIIWKIESRVYAVADGIYREISIETQTDSYDYDYRLKIGYTKIIQLLTRLPDDDTLLMRQVQTETNQIRWTTSQSNPDVQIKTWEITQITGTILVVDNPDDPEHPTKISLYEANRTNDFPEDAEVQLAQPITTIIERWREIGPDQIEVDYQKIDHLAGRPEQTKTVQHTGTLAARMGQAEQTVTMLLRNEAAEATFGVRVPATLDAGDIPFPIALTLAQRLLDTQGASPQKVSVPLAGIDLSMRRGSLRTLVDLQGNEFTVFITGYKIEGRNLNTPQFDVSMIATGIVLNA